MSGGSAPVLSITMPTRNRTALFERALGSVIQATASVAERVEITVSDGSDDDRTGKVAERLLATWPGRHRYVWNRPGLALVDNLNRAIRQCGLHELHHRAQRLVIVDGNRDALDTALEQRE